MEKRSKCNVIASFLFRFLRVILVLAIAGALAFWLYEIRVKPEKKEVKRTPPSVKILEVHPQSETMTVDAFGTVVPRKLVTISVEVPGRIDYFNPAFVEGGEIGDQDLLIRIDQRSYRLDKEAAAVRINQARVEIESLNQDIRNLENDSELAKANVNLTLQELTRIKALTKNQFASKTSLDKVEQQYLAARIQLQTIQNRFLLTAPLMKLKKSVLAMANVEFKKSDLALEKTEIWSGFDGFVLDKRVEVGEYVNPGQALGSIYEKNALDVDVRIPLEQMKWIETFFKDGHMPRAKVSIANFTSSGEMVWNARVARVKARIDEKTRTLPMTLEIQNRILGDAGEPPSSLFDLKPGIFVKCRIIGETRENIFILPRYLLKIGDVLFVVTDNCLEMRKVNVLRKFEEKIYINGGLSKGDLIISSPLPTAIEGMPLLIKTNGS